MTVTREGGIVNWLPHGTDSGRASFKRRDPFIGDPNGVLHDVATVADPTVFEGCDNCGADAHVGVKNCIALVGHGKNQPFHKRDRELARVDCLFRVVTLDVWELPNVAQALPPWVA